MARDYNEAYKFINEIKSYSSKLTAKYLRNLRLYTYSMNVSLDQIKDGSLIGYWHLYDGSSNTSNINENIIQSCIDSLTSQLASKHSRPFISTNNGTFSQMQVSRELQQFFDIYLDEKDINKIVTEAFRDSCIFGEGIVYYDSDTNNIVKALPWQVFYRPSEKTYGDIHKIYYERKQFPTNLLPEKVKAKVKEDYVTYGIYWDRDLKKKYYIVGTEISYSEPYEVETVPFSFINYSSPVFGKDSVSIPDILYGIQEKIDNIYATISEAIRLNPAQTFLVPQGSDIKVTKLNNRVGQVMTYKPLEGVTTPVLSSTPDFIASQYMEMVEKLKDDAYELVGISKLSAQSKKPVGANSGKALQTLNDVESERFETQYKQVINMYTDIIKKFIMCCDPEEFILPDDINRLRITWGQAQEVVKKLKIQFSNMDFLSKDPSTKAQELDVLIQRGVIPQSRAALYFDIPDLTDGYNYANNAINAVMSVINEAIIKEDYNIPPFIPVPLLKAETLNTMLSLKAVEDEKNIVYLQRLNTLYNKVVEMDNNAQAQTVQQTQQDMDTQWQDQLKKQQEQIVNQTVSQAIGQVQAQQITGMPFNTNINRGM